VPNDDLHIAMGYGMGGRGSTPGRPKIFLYSPKFPHQLWGPPNLLSKWVPGALSPGGKAAGREADHSHLVLR
jgi:hypothetical protein